MRNCISTSVIKETISEDIARLEKLWTIRAISEQEYHQKLQELEKWLSTVDNWSNINDK